MAWKSHWQVRREQQAEAQRHSTSFYSPPPPPQFPWGVEAKDVVELAKKVFPEMRQHHVRIAQATKSDANHWKLERHYDYDRMTIDDLPRLMPADAATIARWQKRKLFYAHFGRPRVGITRESIYEDFMRTCGTSANWSDDLPTRLKARDKKRKLRKQRKDGNRSPETPEPGANP